MPHVLIIKTSSMGDIIHTLPALTDAALAIPGLKIDWVVEEKFASLVQSHPSINRVLLINTYQWRKAWLHQKTRQAMKQFTALLRAYSYDYVFDLQGNQVMLLAQGLLEKGGTQSFTWTRSNLQGGVYGKGAYVVRVTSEAGVAAVSVPVIW